MTTKGVYIVEGLVAEPWTAPTFTRFGKGTASKNARLTIFQNALAEAIAADYPDAPYLTGDIVMHLYVWRELERYETESGRKQTRQRADRSNILKATEDALQDRKVDGELTRGVLFKNDKQIVDGRTYVTQAVGMRSLIRIEIFPLLVDSGGD